MYIIRYKDWTGNEHEKKYKTTDAAMKNFFAIRGFYKNGSLTTDEGRKVL